MDDLVSLIGMAILAIGNLIQALRGRKKAEIIKSLIRGINNYAMGQALAKTGEDKPKLTVEQTVRKAAFANGGTKLESAVRKILES